VREIKNDFCSVRSKLLIYPQTGNGVFSTCPGNGLGVNLPPYSKTDLFAIGDRYRPSVKHVYRRIDWRIKSIFYFHIEIPKWPTKWPPYRKLATIFKTDKVKGDINHLWAIFYTHTLIYKHTFLFTTFGDDRKSEFKMAVV